MEDWTEKYRPKSLKEIVGNEKAVIELRKWASAWSNGNPQNKAVILSGKPGIGKTSSAIVLAKDFGWTPIELNTSDARNAQKIKTVATYGAINETFSDDGTFISSKTGGRKLIILDEADNLYERAESSTEGYDLSDRGGKKAIIDTIQITNQPIILIVNDYYSLIKGIGEVLKNICKLIRFYEPYPNQVLGLLKKICLSEGINVDQKVLQIIADRSKGDIRSAINDLQSVSMNRTQIDSTNLEVLGYRDREKDIFTFMREVFKNKNLSSIRESTSHLDMDPNLLILWINENLPKEYLDRDDLVNGFEALSKADIFLGRTFQCQDYCLWSYAYDIMNGGVAVAKTHTYPNDKYDFPVWLRSRKTGKTDLNIKDIIIKKLSKEAHLSNKKNKVDVYSYFIHIFKNDISFAINMKEKLDLTENEVEYLLGTTHSNKLKQIMSSSEIKKLEIQEEKKEENPEEKSDNIQQSLFDF
ncbi:MAG: replication factor C large subunit [Candidatus Thermoplasmatota archaeon]|nr:replication factor C large subunit [Candidatus Thermoplasmatota archaeon]